MFSQYARHKLHARLHRKMTTTFQFHMLSESYSSNGCIHFVSVILAGSQVNFFVMCRECRVFTTTMIYALQLRISTLSRTTLADYFGDNIEQTENASSACRGKTATNKLLAHELIPKIRTMQRLRERNAIAETASRGHEDWNSVCG